MKETSQKLLLLAYPAYRKNFQLTYEHVELLLPDLTSGGRRSLLYHLEKEGYLFKEKVLGQHTISLTSKGVRQCIALFPAFSDFWNTWQGEWELLVFLEAPKSDPQFRYLRNLLLEGRALPIARGVYATPGKFSAKVTETIEQLYVHSVAIFNISEWRFGAEKQLVINALSLVDIIEGYSGVSSELRELLENCENNVRLTDQQKLQFMPVFDRFWEIVLEDTGCHRFYFPNAPTALQILTELQQLLVCLYPTK